MGSPSGDLHLKPDEVRVSAKEFMQVGEAIQAAQHPSLSAEVAAGMHGSLVIDSSRNAEQALNVALTSAGAWPLRVANELFSAVSTITGVDEASAAGLHLDTSGDPSAPGGKPGGEQPKETDHPPAEDHSHDPAPERGNLPMDVPGKGASNTSIDLKDVGYDKSAAGPGGDSATMGRYIDQALDKMGITDPAMRENWKQGYLTLTQRESTYNHDLVPPKGAADVNNTGPLNPHDNEYANATRGCTQLTPDNFARYHQPGTSNNIYDPVANICASMNYVMTHPSYSGDRPVSRDGHDFQDNIQQADSRRPRHWY